MSLLPLPPGVPGIRALLQAYPDTAGPLMNLAEAVLRGPSSLSPGERELLAVAVSVENHCEFCAQSHAATARELLGSQAPVVDRVLRQEALEDARFDSLVALARGTARAPQSNAPLAAAARLAGASDRDLHDTVLVASAFSLYNRYVDGLGAPLPPDPKAYAAMGARLAQSGYR